MTLLNALRLYLPRVVFRGTLGGKSGAATVALTWDPIEQAAEPARCSSCAAFTYELGVGRAGTALCPSCLGSAATPPARR